jgi:hypothetical protein
MMNRIFTLLFLLFSFAGSQGQIISFSMDSATVNEGNDLTLNIELTPASSGDVTVMLSIVGGTAYGKGYISAQGEVFGTGKDYSLSTRKLIIPAGDTNLSIILTAVDDLINENDENLQLELVNPENATLGSPGSLAVKIIDNDCPNLMNVKTQFGANGDGSTDDTQAIQNAIDSLSDVGGGVLVFPAGLYIVSSVQLRENITCEGYGATIKRPDHMDKWTRTFVAYYSGDNDSKPFIIKGFSFDGNSPNQGAYKHWELEQAHLIMIYGDTSKSGHCVAFVEDCLFKNGVGDGVSVYTNADATVYNCEAADVFRGGFVATGGHSKLKVYKFSTRAGDQNDPTGLDIEVDGAGHGNDYQLDLLMDGINCIDGDFDIGTNGGTVIANNCYSSGTFYNFSGSGKSSMKFTNCSIAIGGADSYQRILWPGNLTFEDCTFTISKFSSAASDFYGFDLWWNYPGNPIQYTDQSVTFRNCSFLTDNTLAASDQVQAIHTRYDSPASNNILTIEGNSSISNDFDKGLTMEDGGRWIIRNLQNNAKLAMVIPGAGKIGNISIDGMTATGSKYATITQNADYHTLFQQNVQLTQASNYITAVKGLEKITISGNRIITGISAPDSSTHGFLNDIYRVGSQEWKCTKAGYSKGASQVYSQWASTDTLAQASPARKSSNIMLYPNPVNTILNLSFPNQVLNASVSIFDIRGSIVLNHVCTSSMHETIDVGELSKGMYYVVVKNGNETLNSRFVK